MATSQQTITFLLEQLTAAGDVTARKMFGEYALYHESKVVAFVCDDQLFVKPTDAGRAAIGNPEEAPPYPGAKLYYLIPGDRWDDRDWLCDVIRATADALPTPQPKRPRAPQSRKPPSQR